MIDLLPSNLYEKIEIALVLPNNIKYTLLFEDFKKFKNQYEEVTGIEYNG